MRKGKRAILMAGAVSALLAMPYIQVQAEDGETFTISARAGDTHVYDVYQIFTGDLGSDHQTLSNVKAGFNYKGAADSVQSALNELTDSATDSDTEKLAMIEKYVDLSTEAVASVSSEVPASGLTPGYYLVKDQENGSVGDYDSYTLYVVKVAGNVEIRRKSAVPSLTKQTKDVNDSTEVTSDWQSYADFDKGDTIDFRLTGTLPDNYSQYTTYSYRFHDIISKGLILNEDSIQVKSNDTLLQKDIDYQVITEETEDATTLDIVFNDLKQISTVTEDDAITVDYKATLAEDAEIGNTGNSNTATLEFSNDPNTGGKTSVTPEETVNIYTYQLLIGNKDKNGKELKGAEFTLKKKVGTQWVEIPRETDPDIATLADGENEEVFAWDRIDAGTYKLVQTKTPKKYNKIDDIEFTVSSVYKDGNITGLETKTDGNAELEEALTGDAETGIISGEILSTKATVLPTTGTKGIILLLGGIVVILGAAGAIRMQSKKEKDE